jgi:Protein of unknown function (DUF3684)
MATRFIPTVERESIDLVYALHILMFELMDESHPSDRNAAGQHHPSLHALILNSRSSLE